MILDKTVKIKGNGNNIAHYRNLNYDINMNQIIEISTVDLPKNSHVKINVKCDICETEKNISYYSYCRNIKTEPKYFYIVDRIRKDPLIKLGVDPNKTKQILLKRKISRIYDSGYLKFLLKLKN